MANEILQKASTTQIVFADHANDFAPATGSDLRRGTPTNYEMQTASVADTAAVQSDKFNLGATHAALFDLIAALELAATGLTAGEIIEFYVAWSAISSAANGNPGGIVGANGAYAGYSSNLGDSVKQLDLIGTFVVTGQATATVQIAHCGLFVPKEQYGTLVLKNESGAAIHTDDVECHVVFQPIVDEVQ